MTDPMTLREQVRDAMVTESLRRGHLGVQFDCDYLADVATEFITEACAKVAEDIANHVPEDGTFPNTHYIAQRIRQMGKP